MPLALSQLLAVRAYCQRRRASQGYFVRRPQNAGQTMSDRHPVINRLLNLADQFH